MVVVTIFDTSGVNQLFGWMPGGWTLRTDCFLCPLRPWVLALVDPTVRGCYLLLLLLGEFRSIAFFSATTVAAGFARALALPAPIYDPLPWIFPGPHCRSASRANRCNTIPPSLPILANSCHMLRRTCATATPLDLPLGPFFPYCVPGKQLPPLPSFFQHLPASAVRCPSFVEYCFGGVPNRLTGVPA